MRVASYILHPLCGLVMKNTCVKCRLFLTLESLKSQKYNSLSSHNKPITSFTANLEKPFSSYYFTTPPILTPHYHIEAQKSKTKVSGPTV